MKPTVGRIVHAFTDPKLANGTDVAPAIITRVWSDTMINVTVFPDAGAPFPKTSVSLRDTREEAEAAHKGMFHSWPDALAGVPHRAFWPPRVEHQPGDRPATF